MAKILPTLAAGGGTRIFEHKAELDQEPQDPSMTAKHNNAKDLSITRGPARFFEITAAPLNEHIFGPITRKNRFLGMVAVNVLLTAPRLFEPVAGAGFIKRLEKGQKVRAGIWLGVKTVLKITDGYDGAVARANGVTSLFGAGFDPLVDMLGTRDDGKRIKQANAFLDIQDPVTDAIIDTRQAIDVAVIGVGGIYNTGAAKLAEAHGATIPDRDQPKANAWAKVKYGLSCLGDAIMLGGTLFSSRERQQKAKYAGATVLAGSVIAGAISTVQYHESAGRNMAAFRQAGFDAEQAVVTEQATTAQQMYGGA